MSYNSGIDRQLQQIYCGFYGLNFVDLRLHPNTVFAIFCESILKTIFLHELSEKRNTFMIHQKHFLRMMFVNHMKTLLVCTTLISIFLTSLTVQESWIIPEKRRRQRVRPRDDPETTIRREGQAIRQSLTNYLWNM